VNTGGTFAYLLGWPVVVLGGFGIMVAFLRWTFTGGHSLIARQPKQGAPGEYGLLEPVAAPGNFIEGERLRLLLADSGIRGTLVTTTDGPRLMVFAKEAAIAREILRNPPPSPPMR
jgi:hypothetical protein